VSHLSHAYEYHIHIFVSQVALMASNRTSRSRANCSNGPKINDNEIHADEPHVEEESIHENAEGTMHISTLILALHCHEGNFYTLHFLQLNENFYTSFSSFSLS